MLRIYIHDQVPMTSFVLKGKLVGPSVKELKKRWESALATNKASSMLVDLADVTFIDAEARALLATMRQQGVKLLSTGVLVSAILADIDAEQRKHGAECSRFTQE